MKIQSAPYSYQADPAGPRFDDTAHLTVMDAQCSICARGARWIARNDSDENFKIVLLQSDLGEALMKHYGLDPNDPVSWLYLKDGKAYTSLDAMIRVSVALGGVWRGLSILRVLPLKVQDYLYAVLARNRYRFGNSMMICAMPDPEVKRRIVE